MSDSTKHSRDVAQHAVDYMFGVTRMPVVLTDQGFNVLASSVHHLTDANRRRAILERRSPALSRCFVERLGADVAQRCCSVIPPAPRIGMDLERWCVPVLDGVSALYFWLLREEGAEHRMEEAVAAALDMEGPLRHMDPVGVPDTELVRRCVNGLLDDDPGVRDFARRRLEVTGHTVTAEPDVSIVHGGAEAPFAELVEAVDNADLPTDTLVGTRRSTAVFMSDHGSRTRVTRALRTLVSSRATTRLTVGVTRMHRDETILEAARRAHFMARVAMLPEYEKVMEWEHAGLWAALAGVALEWNSVDQLSPGCRDLVLNRPDLARTARAHLESTSVDSTAEELSIHRTTLYYRLKQIDRYLGAGWNDGWRRAGTHSSLQLGRLLHVMSVEPDRSESPTAGPGPYI